VCTLTCVPGPWLARETDPAPLLRVLFNRDERLARRAAVPPVAREFGSRCAALPIDSDGGGTWIAGSDLGAVFALLNVSTGRFETNRFSDRETRGRIIPSLLDAASLDVVVARMHRLDPTQFAPFRLLCVSPQRMFETWSDGWTLRTHQSCIDAPLMRTSSSLGDSVVASPRIRLFERRFARRPVPLREQDAFHRYQSHARPEVSVLMSRADARTVSVTTVAVDSQHVTMSYAAVLASGAIGATYTQEVLRQSGRQAVVPRLSCSAHRTAATLR